MMRPRLAIAICLALLLVGGATLKRLGGTAMTKSADLVYVSDKVGDTSSDSSDISPSADLSSGTSTVSSTEKLTNTDIISRQLFSDYVGLAANGQATQDNLDALGDQYAESIVTSSQAKSLNVYDLKTESDSKANFQSYSDTLSTIYSKYSAQLITATKANQDFSNLGPDTVAFANKISKIYLAEANELQAIPVPNLFVADHLKLANLYLTNSWNMNAIANADTDPTDAYSAISSESTIDGQEKVILTDIERLLVSNAIILRNS